MNFFFSHSMYHWYYWWVTWDRTIHRTWWSTDKSVKLKFSINFFLSLSLCWMKTCRITLWLRLRDWFPISWTTREYSIKHFDMHWVNLPTLIHWISVELGTVFHCSSVSMFSALCHTWRNETFLIFIFERKTATDENLKNKLRDCVPTLFTVQSWRYAVFSLLDSYFHFFVSDEILRCKTDTHAATGNGRNRIQFKIWIQIRICTFE